EIKLLGVFFNEKLNFTLHAGHIISTCRQSMYLLKYFSIRGLSIKQLNILFRSFIVSRVLYAISPWGGFLSSHDIGRINSMLKKRYRFGYTNSVITFESLLAKSDSKLFSQSKQAEHCLNQLLPPNRSSSVLGRLRTRGHSCTLPVCKTELHKKPFI